MAFVLCLAGFSVFNKFDLRSNIVYINKVVCFLSIYIISSKGIKSKILGSKVIRDDLRESYETLKASSIDINFCTV